MTSTFVAYGAGVNSTALLIGLVARSEPPDKILFADTGGEKPATYKYRDSFSTWLVANGFPAIETVRYKCDDASLEHECLRKAVLPSPAYGGRSCSEKWKIRPQIEYMRQWMAWQWMALREVSTVTRLLGFDADEKRRAKPSPDKGFINEYPLIAWGWTRNDCREVISKSGLCEPPKSACFFCPSSKKGEVRRLALDNPELFARAAMIEETACASGKLTGTKGLGRHWRWTHLAVADAAQYKLFNDPPLMPCECWDG